jgi:hypothetical protein
MSGTASTPLLLYPFPIDLNAQITETQRNKHETQGLPLRRLYNLDNYSTTIW